MVFLGMLLVGGLLEAQDLDQKQEWAVDAFRKKLDGFVQKLEQQEKELGKCLKKDDVRGVIRDADRNIRALDTLVKSQVDYYANDFNKKGCPEENEAVKALRADEKKLRANIERLKGAFETVKGQALESWDPKTYPDLDKDLEELGKIKKSFNYMWKTQEEFNLFPEVWRGLPGWMEWIEDREKHYAKFMTGTDSRAKSMKKEMTFVKRQHKFQKSRMERVINQAIQNAQNLLTQVKTFIAGKYVQMFEKGGQGLQCLVQADGLVKALAEILGEDHATVKQLAQSWKTSYDAASAFSKAAKEAAINTANKEVEEKLAAHEKRVKELPPTTWYRAATDIARVLERLRDGKLAVLIRLVSADDPRVKAYEARIKVLEDGMPEIIKKVRINVINTHEPWTGIYNGADKETIRQEIMSIWKRKLPKEEILEIRFVTKNWKRVVEHVWQKDRFVLRDYSFINAAVYVKRDDKECYQLKVNCNRNHLANDELSYFMPSSGDRSVYNAIWIERLK
jgi:hypothetical protein